MDRSGLRGSEVPAERHAVTVGATAQALDDAVAALVHAYPSAPVMARARAAIDVASRRYVGALTAAGVSRAAARQTLRTRVAHALVQLAGSDVARGMLHELGDALEAP